ncbi:unnamed protein product [Caenorhabditis auriculariae]|uniref:Guided entry of tail-anchored proteins factor 1 n=1 Tax=Caenorhabditis auriculariae TaxID=2777116 RepID=A0A8S1H9X7_9PELO|nr:unnamed protein product [Caenorhabditis auriculariae]
MKSEENSPALTFCNVVFVSFAAVIALHGSLIASKITYLVKKLWRTPHDENVTASKQNVAKLQQKLATLSPEAEFAAYFKTERQWKSEKEKLAELEAEQAKSLPTKLRNVVGLIVQAVGLVLLRQISPLTAFCIPANVLWPLNQMLRFPSIFGNDSCPGEFAEVSAFMVAYFALSLSSLIRGLRVERRLEGRMLELGPPLVSFEPDRDNYDGNITRNFFDVSGLRICTMRNNGALGLTAKSLTSPKVTNVRTKDRGETSTVKFSPNGMFCAMQRTSNAADIIFLEKVENQLCVEMSISTKSKEPILAVEWITNSQILLGTNHGIELVVLNEDKRSSKVLRSMNINIGWASFYAPVGLLIVATGFSCSNLQPIIVAHSQFTRMKNFEVEFGASNSKEKLLEKDITMATIYGRVYVMVLRYSVRNASTTDLALHELPSDATTPTTFKYSLILGFTGGCGIHACDNLIIVHHQSSSLSYIFDVGLSPNRPNHSPLVTVSLKPDPSLQPPPALYTQFWFTFLPNIIIDSNAGMMYSLCVRNEYANGEISDKALLMEYLARRSGEKDLFLRSLRSCLSARALSLRQARKLFNFLAGNLASGGSNSTTEASQKAAFVVKQSPPLLISQQEMQSSVFFPMRDDPNLHSPYVANTMLQYLRALRDNSVVVEAYFIEMVVQTLAEAGEMRKLHQLVTYRVIDDTKPLAFLLLSYEARCPTLFQSGVDILARNKASDEIVEVMLEKNNIVDAIRFIDARGLSDSMIPKVVEAAGKRCSRQTRHAIREHLCERKSKVPLSDKFESLYSDEEVEAAAVEVAHSALFEF